MNAKIPPTPRVFAIVPAAGRSRRMGTDKQLLDYNGRPMLLSVVEPIAAARVSGLAVVTHQRVADALRPLLPPGVVLLLNEDDLSEMVDSVRIGLRHWRAGQGGNAPDDGVLVCPGDQPGLAKADFDACIDAFLASPDGIVIATRDGRRGHPIVFPMSDADFVESEQCDEGLSVLPRAFPQRVRLVECFSPGVTRDVDTPADYHQL